MSCMSSDKDFSLYCSSWRICRLSDRRQIFQDEQYRLKSLSQLKQVGIPSRHDWQAVYRMHIPYIAYWYVEMPLWDQ